MSSLNTHERRLERRHGRRIAGVVAPLAIGVLVFGACGSSDDGATQSTIALSQESTAFVVRPPETTIPVTETSLVEGGISTAAQEYTIQSGDYPLKVANQFGVTVDELVAFNEWGSVDEFPFPGTVIQIPPGATVPAATTTTVAGATPASTAPASTIPDAGDNCGAGEHTVEAGDIPITVAKKYDVTLEALNAANASNPAYSQFIPGQIIIIPGKADC